MSPSDLFGQVLTIETERYGDQLRIVLSGDLDISSTNQLEETLEVAEASDAETICLDLRDVTFVDSMGLRAILAAQLRSSAGGKGLSLIPGSERVQRVFAVTRTAELLRFEDGETPPDNVRRLRRREAER